MTAAILYLDFDGVLHPADVRVTRDEPLCPKVYVRDQPTEEPLFRYMPLLELLLTPHPELRIVLSTSWVRKFGYKFSINQLSPNLRTRVIGAATFPAPTRFDAIDIDAEERGLTSWIALDDDVRGWPDARRHQIVAPSSPMLGLAQVGVAAELAARLQTLCCGKPLELTVGTTALSTPAPTFEQLTALAGVAVSEAVDAMEEDARVMEILRQVRSRTGAK